MKRKSKLTKEQEDIIIQEILETYGTDANIISQFLPGVASILSSFKALNRKTAYGRLFPLTPVEKDKRKSSLRGILEKIHDKNIKVTKEEAIHALEDIGALIESAPFEQREASMDEIKALLKIVTGLAINTKVKGQIINVNSGEMMKTMSLIRGIELNLTWDKRLISININPKEMTARKKALSLIGIVDNN